jgi:hypothetical protein
MTERFAVLAALRHSARALPRCGVLLLVLLLCGTQMGLIHHALTHDRQQYPDSGLGEHSCPVCITASAFHSAPPATAWALPALACRFACPPLWRAQVLVTTAQRSYLSRAPPLHS